MIGALALVSICLFAQDARQNLQEFLHNYITVSVYEMREVENGKILTRILQTEDPREVAVFGMVRVNVSRAQFLDKYRDIVEFKGKTVSQIGKFSDPPKPEDIQTLTLDKEDINDLKNCQPGDCNIQMSDSAMQQLKAGKNVTELAKLMLVQYVDSYLKGGDLSLSVYHDRKYPTYLALEFESLLNNSKYIKEYAPEFDNYLRKFPNAQLNGVENFIYWEKAKFAKKPVISITHVCIYQPDDQRAIIASKQIYSSHYFTGILGLTGLIDATP
ncbi:MAG: hypothetical protein C5B54_06260, partial [Acidobacteria bacterium]